MATKPKVQGITQTKIDGAYKQLYIMAGRLKGYGESRQDITKCIRQAMDSSDDGK